MTRNMIDYWNYVEAKRTNQAKEAELNRSNLAKEAETRRANKAQERLKKQSNQIAGRQAEISAEKVQNDRELGLRSADLNERSLSQTRLRDTATASINRYSAATNYEVNKQRNANQLAQLATTKEQLQELARSNQAREILSANQMAQAAYQFSRQQALEYQKLREQRRANTLNAYTGVVNSASRLVTNLLSQSTKKGLSQ